MGAALCCLVLPRLEAAKVGPLLMMMMMTPYKEAVTKYLTVTRILNVTV